MYAHTLTHAHTHPSPHTRTLARVLAPGSFSAVAALYNLESGVELVRFEGHTRAIFAIQMDVRNALFYSGSADGTIKEWELFTGAALRSVCSCTSSAVNTAH